MKRYLETYSLLESEPERWLACKSLLHVDAFFAGFSTAEVVGKDIGKFTPIINGFSIHICEKYGDGWKSLYRKGYDDSCAFSLYFAEWRAFIEKWQLTFALDEIVEREPGSVDIRGILKNVRARVGMYFPYPSVSILFSYLSGFQRSRDCYARQSQLKPDLRKFETWLCRGGELCRWDRLLLLENYFNERAAFEQFFDRIDDYEKESASSDH